MEWRNQTLLYKVGDDSTIKSLCCLGCLFIDYALAHRKLEQNPELRCARR